MNAYLESLWDRLRRWVVQAKDALQRANLPVFERPGLRAALSDPDPTARWRTVRALAATPRPQLIAELLTLLNDPDPILRDETALTLAAWGAGYSLAPVLAALAGQPSAGAGAALLRAISLMPDASARPHLLPYLQREEPELRAAAAAALGALAPTTSAPPHPTETPDLGPEELSPSSGTAGTPDIDEDVIQLMTLLADESEHVRRAACTALGRRNALQAVATLEQMQRDDADPLTRQAAAHALTRMRAVSEQDAAPQTAPS